MKKIPQMEPWFDEKERTAMAEYLKGDAWLTEFKKTEEFAGMIAGFTGAKHCIIVNNGTISLTLALLTAGLQPGDEVIVPDLTMIASANCAKMIGAKPVFADIEKKTLCLDLEKAEEKLTPKTRALIYVSYNGRCGDINAVKNFCGKNNLFFLEDAAQSLGSCYGKTHLGRIGDIGSFSFSVPKVITTGQGGALITDNDKTAETLKRIKDFGRTRGGIDLHDFIGYNSKFTDLQAVIGIEQMKKLPSRIKRKKEICRLYIKLLSQIPEVELIPTNLDETLLWFIDIYVPDPDKLQVFLKEKGIGTRRDYPPIHSQKAYNLNEHYPVTEDYSSRGLWIPSSSKLTDDDIKYVCGCISEFYKNNKSGS
ncbi:MAG: DegT/DnrJ/EryC1/StrS aminotransferase family protein [Elusimicrobia bacterium]|nr:DegT/DnrJ/EryC1/StrS aminotransferase family protein [Elusimicrobiota bacterium]